jgi:hypothetical protein
MVNTPTKSYLLSHARAAPPNDATQSLPLPSDCKRRRQGMPEPHPPETAHASILKGTN